ncbi:microtubule nucleation factor SSNA1-like [Halichondria panicea]|uniref:microtubule nucleation factor SSNA1-like n=1 Tax=Halichondria panicea TaxID=6063 RepID=UPI00312B9B0F
MGIFDLWALIKPVKHLSLSIAMSQQGAALQGYNNELIKCIEDLCSKRDELQKQILVEEEEKQRVQNDLRILTERLAQINEGLAQKIAMRNDYDRTISETENAYKKILESSQSLLQVLKKESTQLKDKSTSEMPRSRTKQSTK